MNESYPFKVMCSWYRVFQINVISFVRLERNIHLDIDNNVISEK